MVDVETFGYTLLTSVLGMLIVFGFLWFLSLLMGLLVRIFKEKSEVAVEKSETSEASDEGESWLFAAVTAFLSEEERECSVSAAPWKPVAEEKSNPWLQSPKLPGKWSGV